MDIKFSRHAKRRMKLYDMSELIVCDILKRETLSPGKQEIVRDISRFHLPLKVVFSVENEQLTVITTYLLKKRRQE